MSVFPRYRWLRGAGKQPLGSSGAVSVPYLHGGEPSSFLLAAFAPRAGLRRGCGRGRNEPPGFRRRAWFPSPALSPQLSCEPSGEHDFRVGLSPARGGSCLCRPWAGTGEEVGNLPFTLAPSSGKPGATQQSRQVDPPSPSCQLRCSTTPASPEAPRCSLCPVRVPGVGSPMGGAERREGG